MVRLKTNQGYGLCGQPLEFGQLILKDMRLSYALVKDMTSLIPRRERTKLTFLGVDGKKPTIKKPCRARFFMSLLGFRS